MVASGDPGETQDSCEAGMLLNAFGGGKKCKQGCWRQAKLLTRKKLGSIVKSCITFARILTSTHMSSNCLKWKGA